MKLRFGWMAALALAAGVAVADEEPVLNVYNWNDYIAADTIPAFEKASGLAVRYEADVTFASEGVATA